MNTHELSNTWSIVLAGGEGTRVRDYLKQRCGGRGIKQFCAVVGRRSMLEHTLARVERVIPRERTFVIVGQNHRAEAVPQLAQWPQENIIWQPTNCDTAPGILLPLAHISARAPFATVAVFPSDHFILDEALFMRSVGEAMDETRRYPHCVTLLGMTPDAAEDGYGWIEPAAAEAGRTTRAVRQFWEKPSDADARALLRRGALWNTFVFVAQAATLWEMTRQTAPDLYDEFMYLRRFLYSPHAEEMTNRVYSTLRSVNFSSDICEALPARLRVLRVPEVGWSDWGSEKRIRASLQQLGKLDPAPARHRHVEPSKTRTVSMPLMRNAAFGSSSS